MARIRTLLTTTVATGALVLAGTAPAHAARSTSFGDARDDVRDYETDEGVSGRRASIDLRKGRAVTAGKFRGSVRVTYQIANVRRRQPQAVYFAVEQAGDEFFAFAPLDRGRARVNAPDTDGYKRCGGSRIDVSRKRDRVIVTTARRCLGGGRSVVLEEVATFYTETPALEDIEAYDRTDAVTERSRTLRYPRKRR